MNLKNIILIALLSGVVQAVLILAFNDSLRMNPDEELNYHVATNHIQGHGYTIFDEHTYAPTAIHSRLSVYTYEIISALGISRQGWVVFIYALSILLHIISGIYFFRLAAIFISPALAMWSTAAYCFYPSIIYFIGSLFLYENIVTPLLVINFYLLVSQKRISAAAVFFISVSIVLSCWLRPHVALIYFLMLSLVLLHNFHEGLSKYFLVALPAVLLAIPVIGIVRENKKLFGHYIFTTEFGFEFLQGHNPSARGSWMVGWGQKGNVLYNYSHAMIPGLNTMNELEESRARTALATQWIKANPLSELKLILKKIAIYFAPFNYDARPGNRMFNPLGFAAHLFFLCWLLFAVLRKKILRYENSMLIVPILSTLLISVVFFTGYRWRFYAEPFMILTAFIFVYEMKNNFQWLKNFKVRQEKS